MAAFMNNLDNDCIIIDDDNDDEDNIENIHNSNYTLEKSCKDDEDIEIIFDSASTKVLNNNNDNNCRKRTYSALNEAVPYSKKIAVIDLTDDNDEFDMHVKFRKKILKDYPGLCVDMINGLYFYNRLSEYEKKKRLEELEDKVKEVASLSIGKLEVWLIKKVLIFQTHYCNKHKNPDGSRVKMKLLQSNLLEHGSIFKWHRSCCTGNEATTTLYYRGFFDEQPSPRFVLHMLHHWIALSKPLNISKDINNVSLGSINKLFYEMRAVCTAAIHEKFEKFGGQRKVVEVCMMYVGVKDNTRNTKKLKVIIVAAYDVASKKKIIFALPPKSQFKNDGASLAILTKFIDPKSFIVIDKTVNRNLFTNVGFENVFYPFNDGGIPVDNSHVLQFTRTTLHIFDASLTYLSIEQIQLCLNELIWREKWGSHSWEAYNNFLAHVSELTKVIQNFKSQRTLHSVLHEIVANPYKYWSYSALECNLTNQIAACKRVCLSEPSTKSPNTVENTSSMPILEPYYYGTYPGDEVTLSSEVNHSISCHLCEKNFSKNDLFIHHLVKHSLSKTAFDKIDVCTICLKSFTNKLKLTNHISIYHREKPSETSCLICDEDFSYRPRLLEHMRNTHAELDLPYRCGLCNFMCSEQKKLSEHFSSFHNDGENLWCPVCFKIFNFLNIKQGRHSFTDFNNFSRHIMRHLLKPFVTKCLKCSVHFIHNIVMKEHLVNNHGSCRDKPGVVRYSSGITERDNRIVRDRMHNSASSFHNRVLKRISDMYSVSIQTTFCADLPASYKCIECEGALIYHKFNSEFHCKKCAYSTSCDQAIKYHIIDVHMKVFSKHSLSRYKDNSVSCVCGYQTKHSNKIAKHFNSCKYKLLEACNEDVMNNFIVSSVILKKTVSIFQVQSTPNILLSLGLIKQR